jgi:hydroxymethylbilane synthase
MPSSVDQMTIVVGARASPLSQAQFREFQEEFKISHPGICLEPLWIETTGDKDQTVSLRTLDKTDFFTKEIDQALLTGKCRLAVHSAKDLPEPMPPGLKVVKLTQGVDSSDALVLRQGECLETLPPGAVVATSSERREAAVRCLRADLQFVDIRGAIHQRLAVLESGRVDGVVIAEAALIRLGLTSLNRVKLPGETTQNQGRLAIVARADDEEMAGLFTEK